MYPSIKRRFWLLLSHDGWRNDVIANETQGSEKNNEQEEPFEIVLLHQKLVVLHVAILIFDATHVV